MSAISQLQRNLLNISNNHQILTLCLEFQFMKPIIFSMGNSRDVTWHVFFYLTTEHVPYFYSILENFPLNLIYTFLDSLTSFVLVAWLTQKGGIDFLFCHFTIDCCQIQYHVHIHLSSLVYFYNKFSKKWWQKLAHNFIDLRELSNQYLSRHSN